MNSEKNAPDSHGWLISACCAAMLVGIAGCAHTSGSTDENYGGDLPWATPATWEGTPSIPGLSDR